MILVYTGNGKGKTSACTGQALRALGQGLEVRFAQFIKKDVGAGEQRLLRKLLGDGFFPGGEGFFLREETRAVHRRAAERTLAWCRQVMPEGGMLIADEALYALGCGLLTREELSELMDLALSRQTHLVLSGRGLPDWLSDRADLISEVREIKHPAAHGAGPVRGIEF
ncbi:MAG TPA: cob(I)yrinic acid a,c-diamide adenosyltransferase [Candidatus Avidesulfovibrio excrementigallinarum]|nr:cob(I)yrinic acid a,c-diamide adenosyltransferase [Candidatus Avidesulfovibrio excrementigallinarum]